MNGAAAGSLGLLGVLSGAASYVLLSHSVALALSAGRGATVIVPAVSAARWLLLGACSVAAASALGAAAAGVFLSGALAGLVGATLLAPRFRRS